ncbi:MAG TPA: bifunctional diguanylate cyclase/phosphodiesterase [Solimonas sp.]|nr:bifunctional diguanylate cyclase/phosphodiesterase [Solimonas sp.]
MSPKPQRLTTASNRFRALHKRWRHEHPCSRYGLMLIRLDQSHAVSESMGEEFNALMIQHLGVRIGHALRNEDRLEYLGDHCFGALVVLSNGEQGLVRVAAKLLSEIRQPVRIAGCVASTTASIGLSSCPADGDNLDALLGRAAVALERAQHGGGDHFELFDRSLGERLRRSWDMSARLWRAYEWSEFTVAYQPIVDATSSRICGTEALLRWQDPALGPQSPSEFVPQLEQSGLIVPIGEWMLRTASGQMRTLQHAGMAALSVAVNVSPRQFDESNLAERVRASLRETQFPPEQLQLEITENMLIRDPDTARDTINSLATMGVRVYIDDFGTGHSSISYLRKLPVAGIKIDQSFVSGLPHDESSTNITRTIIGLAQNMRLEIVAEGVETAEQARFLSDHGVQHLQGFLFSQALPLGELIELLRKPLPTY